MDIFSALAVPTRRTILEVVAMHGKLSSSEISQRFNISPQAISQHLQVLRDADLLFMQKQGQKRMYSINPTTFLQLEDWSHKITREWEERFERLDELLLLEKNKE